MKRLLSIQTIRDGGGAETALIRMIRQLRADGWECHVALQSRPRLEAEYLAAGAVLHIVAMERITLSGNRLAWLARFVVGWPVSVLRLALLARRVRADVVHSNSLHYLHGWAAAALIRRPHVWHAREIVAQSGAALRVERALARRYATVVVAISAAVAAQLDPANVVTIFDRPDPEEFTPARAGRFRASLGVADDAPVVGAACRIDTWKGIDVLLDAVPLLREARPDIEVVVAGDPVGGKDGYAAGLARRAEALGVRWLGARRDIPDMLADLDVFAQVSTLPEPFGLGLVEALSSGCPVVATAGGGPVEILARVVPEGGDEPSDRAGRLVPFSDPQATAAALLELLAPVTSSARRRQRPRLVPDLGETMSFCELFDGLVGAPAVPLWRR
ncbi:glycosyltransferase family 4 protein [Acidiferrimicrobium sp. IK]|uniref:glycosyltransferase family 4 protein n=1 Tax=Acidiferrimicrobium sp. IK TaxID=2871700 RepID=UPI0021CB97AA|nr:glycosyltransferase family 4 protein [Acidiferrimicrobium sp. IK]MCU4185695.1 glycosyltransferase family 4 protein [Acidiferrimicrobium sp. IK]